MTDRFAIHNMAVRGRVGIVDTANGNKLVAFFLGNRDKPEAPRAMAEACIEALNATVKQWAERKRGDHVA
jgi:predicted metal-dependent enzyme (double-stranded beta helix superfamily)